MSGQTKFDDIACVAKANSILISVRGLLEKELEGRAGGYLVVADQKGLPVFLDRMGEIPEEKLNQYYTNALEKVRRLAYAHRFAGHKLSRQSRDENRQEWIGAAAGNDWLWSFSGFPEDCDEVFVVALALGCGDLHGDHGYNDIALAQAMLLLRVGARDENPHLNKVDGLLRTLGGAR